MNRYPLLLAKGKKLKKYIATFVMTFILPIYLFAAPGSRGWQEYSGGGGTGPIGKFIAFCLAVYFWKYSVLVLGPVIISKSLFGSGLGPFLGGLAAGLFLLMKSVNNGWFLV